MLHCTCEVSVKVGGVCYFCAKIAAGLIGYSRNGATLSPEQQQFIGVVDPDVSGALWIPMERALPRIADAELDGMEASKARMQVDPRADYPDRQQRQEVSA